MTSPTSDSSTVRGGIACGFTLVELLTVVAALVIVLGLAVSLAREVRQRSADQLTRRLLMQLDQAMAQYQSRASTTQPAVAQVMETTDALGVDRDRLARLARKNNQDVVRLLKPSLAQSGEAFGELPISLYDDITLRDAWGSPLVYMPSQHPLVGMASRDRPWFFFSAGPDRDYLTRADNLYSYESR